MASPKRTSLSHLVEKKTEPPAPGAPVKMPPLRAAAAVDFKTMQVRVNRAGWLEMTRLAQDLDIPLEELMVEAFNDVLMKHKKQPAVERRQPIR